jgi:CubicO group peptidase (beta-lactamase class C family)
MQINYIMHEVGVPGMSLAIIDNNQIVFSNVYGYKNLGKKEKVNKRTIFEICSLSKTFLAFVAHMLVEEGKLDLNKPMYQYLKNENLEHDSRYKLITPRMILSHCSGIENWKGENNPDTLEIMSTPGKLLVYSGEGYNYLAQVIEKILNQSYEEYITEMVIKPLQLKRTFLKYTEKNGLFHKSSPTNYAVGYNFFGEEFQKWKNKKPIPAATINCNTEDYAKFLIAFFDKYHLSENRINDIIKPIARLEMNNTFYGQGFEVFYGKNDTIISHGGNNPGFKAWVFYSVVNNYGFVYLTNSDNGLFLAEKLAEISTGMNIHSHFEKWPFPQYPSDGQRLLKIYNEKDSVAMFAEIEKLKSEGKMKVTTLNILGFMFLQKNEEILKRLLEDNIKLYPNSSFAYGVMAELSMSKGDYDVAIKNFAKAKELKFDLWDIEYNIKKCKEEINKRNKLPSVN